MTLEKAIDELRNQCCVPNSKFQKSEYQARVLGIEALKRIERHRAMRLPASKPLLPGETP